MILHFFSMESQQFQTIFLPEQPGSRVRLETILTPASPLLLQDYIVWSLYSFVWVNPCLGLAALIFSIKAQDRKVVGDLEAAREYGNKAICLNAFALIVTSVIVLVIIIFFTLEILTIHS
ncbi:dispanin subfamily A member 2b-like [Arapaima gigas]